MSEQEKNKELEAEPEVCQEEAEPAHKRARPKGRRKRASPLPGSRWSRWNRPYSSWRR